MNTLGALCRSEWLTSCLGRPSSVLVASACDGCQLVSVVEQTQATPSANILQTSSSGKHPGPRQHPQFTNVVPVVWMRTHNILGCHWFICVRVKSVGLSFFFFKLNIYISVIALKENILFSQSNSSIPMKSLPVFQGVGAPETLCSAGLLTWRWRVQETRSAPFSQLAIMFQ